MFSVHAAQVIILLAHTSIFKISIIFLTQVISLKYDFFFFLCLPP